MNTKKIITYGVSVATGLLFLAGFSPLTLNAQTAGVNVSTNATVKATLAATRLAKVISQSDSAISARITALNNLSARVSGLKNVSDTEKTTISNEIQNNISGLTTLKAKIDADTDITVAQTDAKSILGAYRIYALVIPQGYIAASGDRINTIVGMMTTISTKLQARITADSTAGKNVTSLQASLTDLNAKLADATTQAADAQSGVASLVPDQGDKTQMQANTAALKAARANIKTATGDLQAARKDAQDILKGLKSLNVKVSGSASTSATTN